MGISGAFNMGQFSPSRASVRGNSTAGYRHEGRIYPVA
jgi:hypothetical protein